MIQRLKFWSVAGLLALAIGLFVPAGAVLAQGEGSIEGRVQLADSGDMLADQEVQLDHFEGMSLLESLSTKTDARGGFRFEGLNAEEGHVYIVRVFYQGMKYSSGMVMYEAGAPLNQVVDMTVTPLALDESGLVIERSHLIVKLLPEGVQVGEMYVISNTKDEPYAGGTALPGGKTATIQMLLPQGATQLAFEDGGLGERYIEFEGGVADTQPVPAGDGTVQIIFSYLLPVQQTSWTLEHSYAYPVKTLNALVTGEGWRVESDSLGYAGTMGSGEAYESFSGQGLAADSRVTLTFTPDATAGMGAAGREASAEPASPSQQPTLLWISMAFGALLLLGVGSYPAWRGAFGRVE